MAYADHPEYPAIKPAVEETLRILSMAHHVFGWRLVSESNGDGTWSVKGYVVVTQHKTTGIKGITEFDRNGYGIRDSLLHSREDT